MSEATPLPPNEALAPDTVVSSLVTRDVTPAAGPVEENVLETPAPSAELKVGDLPDPV
ncbi:hypothetical protein KW786_02240 [Candidatus Parcubacteria bacterium]|nr:hypothetical protein [Candidatus Parcubacteria bacterium]